MSNYRYQRRFTQFISAVALWIIAFIGVMMVFFILYEKAHADEIIEEPISWVDTWTVESQPTAQAIWDEYVGNPDLLTEEDYYQLDTLVFERLDNDNNYVYEQFDLQKGNADCEATNSNCTTGI